VPSSPPMRLVFRRALAFPWPACLTLAPCASRDPCSVRWVIQQQHKTTKKQKYAAHDAKQLKIKAEVGKMRENFVR